MTNLKDFDWKEYEFITKYIYESLENNNGIKIEGFGNTCKIEGKSGIKHQIDILAVNSTESNSFKTAIECKYLNKKVTKDTVMKLNSILIDTEIEKGVIVSKSGFTKDAIRLAQHYNIGLIELSHFDPKLSQNILPKYEIATITPIISIEIRKPIIKSIIAIPSNFEIKLEDICQIYISIPPTISHSLNTYVDLFQKEINKTTKLKQLIEKEYEINGYIVNINSDSIPTYVKKLLFQGELIEIQEKHMNEITLIEKTFMIMKSIFENKNYSISEHGIVQQH